MGRKYGAPEPFIFKGKGMMKYNMPIREITQIHNANAKALKLIFQMRTLFKGVMIRD